MQASFKAILHHKYMTIIIVTQVFSGKNDYIFSRFIKCIGFSYHLNSIYLKFVLMQKPDGLTTFRRSDGFNYMYLSINLLTLAFVVSFFRLKVI